MTESTTEATYIRSIFQTNTEETRGSTLTSLLLQWLETTSPTEWEVNP